MKTLASLLMVAVLLSVSFAADDVIVVETIGRGLERNEAIKDAIYLAVGQAKGIVVNSDEYDFDFFSASVDVDRQGTKKTAGVDVVNVENTGTSYKNKISGVVKTYEVLEEKELDDGTYEVKLKVYVYDYTPLDQSDKIKVAVMAVNVNKRSYVFGNTNIPGQEVSNLLTNKLANALTQTNKFAVIDRQHMDKFAREQRILLSDSASLAEKAKIGKMLGADYMLIAEVTDFELIKKTITEKATNHTRTEYEANFGLSYKMISPPTSQVKLADELFLSLENKDIRKFTKYWQPERWDYTDIKNGLFSQVAKQTIEVILERLYPAKIASVQKPDIVIINQGGKTIIQGGLYQVFIQGKEIIDSDTGLSLGQIETPIATIEVNKVLANISYAQVIAGDLSKITEGLVCRAVKEEKYEPAGAKSDVIKTRSGGVKLPFD